MIRSLLRRLGAAGPLFACAVAGASAEPIRVGFLWHMHQPVYVPGVPLSASDPHFSFSPVDVHNQRYGPYTTWPSDAVTSGSSLPHLGAQVSFSGSLIGNLDDLATTGALGGAWVDWEATWRGAQASLTSLGNRRLELVAFGYHHPLMPLLDEADIRMQIRLHKHVYGDTWATTYSRGLFPPETAFSTRMIPALVAEGIDWVLADNIHFDRASKGYPHTPAAGLMPPNPADQINPDPATTGGAWVQLQNLWAPSRVSAPFGYQPHYAQHVDPDTGEVLKMVVVPAARYEGNEDGRGGYGAFLYDQVMDAYLGYNTEPDHPMFVVLHHDGDNFGGGSDAYYHANFDAMVAWDTADPDYEVTTIADYLDGFPPDPQDVIHVEDGAWAGADNGDPQFSKWLGEPGADGVSPDRHSWAVLMAARNRVFTADAQVPVTDMQNVLDGTGNATERAWHYLLTAQASDYWYWDGSPEPWDGNVTRACNLAVTHADTVLAGVQDSVAPTVFVPQRKPYNPGGFEWGTEPEPSEFEVWTLVYDVSGLASVRLNWRVDADGDNPLGSVQNETYAGGAEVGAWQSVAMVASDVPAPAGIPVPAYRAQRYAAMITELTDVLVDYYVEAIDGEGNVARSPIRHVYVGDGAGQVDNPVTIAPNPAMAGEAVTVRYVADGGPLAAAASVLLHYGFDGWSTVVSPDAAMILDPTDGAWTVQVTVPAGVQALDIVFNDGAGTWDNNAGQDWHFPVIGSTAPAWVMDGQADAAARLVADTGGVRLWAGLDGDTLYVATDDAGEGRDVFLLVAHTPGATVPAPWAKAGSAAAWDAFLADENDNDYVSWFDQDGVATAATGANGGVLEGTIDLVGEFGSVPERIALAVVHYQSADGGALDPGRQIAASINGDGNVDAAEYLLVDTAILATGCDVNSIGNTKWPVRPACLVVDPVWQQPAQVRPEQSRAGAVRRRP